MGPQVGPQRKKGRESLNNGRFDSNKSATIDCSKNYLLSAKVSTTWTRSQGPFTRAQRRQSKPNTRNMRRLDLVRKLKFMCGCYAEKSKCSTTPRQCAPKSRRRNKPSKKTEGIKKHSNLRRNRTYKGRTTKSCGEFGKGRSFTKVSRVAARGRTSAATRRLTRFGEYIHLFPFESANSKGSVKQVAISGCRSTEGKLHQDSKSFVLQGGFYPRVTLCDIGPICVECKHKCSFVLPDNVKSKRVHCFTKEMRARFRFEPGCLSQEKHSFNERHRDLNNGRVPNLDSEKCLSQLTNPREQNEDATHSVTLSSHHALDESCGSASCSPELILTANINGMQKKCMDYNQNILGKDPWADNLNFREKAEDSHLKNSFTNTLEFVASVDYQSDSSAQSYSPVHVVGESRDEQLININGSTLDNAEDLESLTCQRVRVYSGKTTVSCARTYLTWPFLTRKKSLDSAGNKHPQLVPKEKSKVAENVVGVSLDITQNKNSLYSSCSSQQSVLMLPGKQNSFCTDLDSWLSGKKTFEQMPCPNNDSGRSTPSGLTETAPSTFVESFTDANSHLSSVSSSPSLTISTPNVFRITLPQVVNLDSLDSNNSCESSLLLPQDMEVSMDETSRCSPPKLEPYFKTSPLIHSFTNAFKNKPLESHEKYVDSDILLPPLLSPLNSPMKHIACATSLKFKTQNRDLHSHTVLLEDHISGICDVSNKNHAYSWQQKETFTNNNDVSKFVESPNKEVKHQFLAANTSPPAALTDLSSSPSSVENEELQSSGEYCTDQESCASEKSVCEEPEEELDKPEVLDEIEAYEQDILIVDVLQDDHDLFEKLPQKSLLKLGPNRTSDNMETGRRKIVKIMPPVSEPPKISQSVAPVNLNFLHHSPENSPRRPWRPQSKGTTTLQSSTRKHFKVMGPVEPKVAIAGEERAEHFPTAASFCYNHISPHLASRLGLPVRTTNTPNAADIRWQKPAYCRNYFSETQNCGFKMCRFHHVPMEGDEKFCTETVAWFTKNPACLHKAGAVFVGYYQKNKPGMFFSKPVFAALLRGLLQSGMLADIFLVLKTSLFYNIVPECEFLLDLFNFIREKNLMTFVPELMQLTLKMDGAGLHLNLDCLDCVKNTDQNQPVSTNSISVHRVVTPTEDFNLTCALVEMELCTKQQDWRRLGEVFQSFCHSALVSQMERYSGRIAVTLLSESKDRLTLPFAAFAETAGHNVDEDSPVKSCIGRIGVSLMLRYHKTHQWVKGQKVVEVLAAAKISYATMKGLFGNEDCTSRCHLVSVATELFLLNGSVEGALNTLRDHIDISKYTPFFTTHLQVCLDRQVLLLASDVVNFMLSKNLTVDPAMLQMLLHRLGKQNFWLKAREVFRNLMSKGYHPEVSAPPGLMILMVPSQLGEIELALTFEMFITLNATAIHTLPECTTSTMTITLKRTHSCESDYLSAGSRLLSAACILQPKVSVHYTDVNLSQEQVFTLDISSARRWLRHNGWANDVWTLPT
ncbi:hypothetical protein WMY93_019473 [Mugilogobius chulae]|uniref:Protein TOPAZ1 n=1 Tax=Mugilogobius chulae TaxID=88201 RepID=A0AAW0NEB9_9GOBI